MENNGILRQARIRHWAEIINERKSSGKDVMTWCMENNINKGTYYYWQRKLRIAECEQAVGLRRSDQAQYAPVRFTQVTMRESHDPLPTRNETGEIRVEAVGLRISADSSYPTDKLASLLRRLVEV